MLAELASAGVRAEYVGLGCLWIAVGIRARSAVRSPRQHGLWLAVAAAAVAMTLSLDAVERAVFAVTGPTRLVGLGRNLVGVLSAGAVLESRRAPCWSPSPGSHSSPDRPR